MVLFMTGHALASGKSIMNDVLTAHDRNKQGPHFFPLGTALTSYFTNEAIP